MPVYEAILPHLAPFVAVLARIGGLFIFAPIFSSSVIPARIKALLVLGLSFAIYPTVDIETAFPVEPDLILLLPMIIGEVTIGMAVGFIANLPLIAAQMGGLISGQQMGLRLADVFNPAADASLGVVDQIMFYLAMGMFLLLGGMDWMFGAVVHSFGAIPLGDAGAVSSPLPFIAALIGSSYELAIRIAAPILCILFLENMAVGFIMKTVPQLNILSFGFPMKILGGVTVLIASLVYVNEAMQPDIEGALLAAFEWATTPAIVQEGVGG